MYYFCNTYISANTGKEVEITVIQSDIAWGRTADNIAAADAAIAANPGADMYVLPEMWATGFMATNPEKAVCREAVGWMAVTAKATGAAVCGGLAARDDDGSYRNRLYFVKPDGEICMYDKHHLFTPGGESARYMAGNSRKVVNYGGMRFMLATCYDLRFPVWLRNCGDYDAMILVANWPGSRDFAWQTLLRARAIENQCYVIGANRTGHDPMCSYIGNSAVIGPTGNTLACAVGPGAQAVKATIGMDVLAKARLKFPVLADRDTWTMDFNR